MTVRIIRTVTRRTTRTREEVVFETAPPEIRDDPAVIEAAFTVFERRPAVRAARAGALAAPLRKLA